MLLLFDGQRLHAVGGEDLIDLLLGLFLADALLGGNDLSQLVSASSGGLEVFRSEFWVLGSESGSDFVETHGDCVVWYVGSSTVRC